MSAVMDNRPKVGVAVIVVRDNKVLFSKRIGSHGAGTWCPPGGHLEFNEGLEECAKREVMEEAGIKIKDVKFGAITNDIFKEEGKHYITVVMISKYDSGEPKVMEPDKSESWEWFEWDKLPQPLFLPIQNLLSQEFDPIKNF